MSPSGADIALRSANVRLTPESGHGWHGLDGETVGRLRGGTL
jgi:hypothetical protein